MTLYAAPGRRQCHTADAQEVNADEDEDGSDGGGGQIADQRAGGVPACGHTLYVRVEDAHHGSENGLTQELRVAREAAVSCSGDCATHPAAQE